MKNVVIVALARNCVDGIIRIETVSRDLNKLGCGSVVVIGENGSSDGSREYLERSEYIHFIDTSFMNKFENRYEMMSEGRQVLFNYCKKLELDFTHCLTIDIDGIEKDITAIKIMGMIEYIENNSDVFAISPQSKPNYYDLIALKLNIQTPNYCEIKKIMRQNPVIWILIKFSILNKITKFMKNKEILVVSAFNGYCLYKFDYYRLGGYKNLFNFDYCEHLVHNLSIYKSTRKKILISNEFFVNSPIEHKDSLKNLFRRFCKFYSLKIKF